MTGRVSSLNAGQFFLSDIHRAGEDLFAAGCMSR